MNLTTREAAASDYDDLSALFDEGDTLHRKNLPHIFKKPRGPVRDKDYVLGLISDEAVGLFVAQLEDQLVGLVCVIVKDSSAVPIIVPRRYAVVDNLVVREGFRRAGIGRALMEKAHEWAVTEGADSIELNVWEFNKEAIEFYQQLGYRTASRKMSKRVSQESNLLNNLPDPKANFDFNTFPVLSTQRLVLRELRRSDVFDVLVFRGDPIVQKYDDPAIHTVAEAQTFIDEMNDEYRTRRGITWGVALSDTDVVVGAFGLHHWDQYHRRAEAGYGLAHAYWGQGYGSEALRAMVLFGFEQLNLNRIYARTIADNHESVRLLERLGFLREGTQRKHSWEDDGTFHDSAIYGLLREEFLSAT